MRYVRIESSGGFTGILDTYGGAAMAFSLRLLSSTYTAALVRVQAYSGATLYGEADVMPYLSGVDYVLDLNSTLENLDATATGRGLTTSSTLGDLVDTGGSNYNGRVPNWYDQSGNGRDAVNSTASRMPQIVSSGALILDNSKPCIQFDGVFDWLLAPLTASQPLTLFNLRKYNVNGTKIAISYGGGAGSYADVNVGGEFKSYYGAYVAFGTQNTNRGLWYSLANGVSSAVGLDSATAVTGNGGTGGATGTVSIGSGGSSFLANINEQEIIIYNSNESANRSGIEANINTFY